MLRLSLAARLSMIVIIVLMAVWLAALASFYRSRLSSDQYTQPKAQQIAAIVNLVEGVHPEQRPLILDAVTSSILEIKLETGQTQMRQKPASLPNQQLFDNALLQNYIDALGEHPFTITSVRKTTEKWRLLRFSWMIPNALEFRITLKTGDLLIIDAQSPLAMTRLGWPVGFGAGLLGTLVALVALILMYRETRPLSRLAAAVDRMDLIDTPVVLPKARTSALEVQALIAAFNRLQNRLAQLLRARMAMLGGISHDVRTFATRLRLRVEQIPEGTERDRAIGDIADMIRLLDDALLASRAGAGEFSEELVELDQIVRSEVEDRKAAGASIDLSISRGAVGIPVLGDRLALRRIVSNLADNALQYGHSAYLTVEIEAQTLVLSVDDEGAGIPSELSEILLEPFVRLETSRNRRTGGAGLGLAIVRTLIEAHSGTISIGAAPTGGARFIVRLPIFTVSSIKSKY
ncbi:sensor histidine kinase [Beijerinckia indica]|uniref:histidine kinase n=1 Tax=Beijerinckia indica subsp. indica (strain ATCC 9039 / DSM 1715 / NCIMB 8712) TaxID=395963 RepID=B2ILC8_BEII9|nr:ATP-binding protein [Beijerinckia indica]ACB97328.1 integral membrane sensor signal transduction histidine kinase [Beijerinckia indica subsp. indica ATCC 9039]